MSGIWYYRQAGQIFGPVAFETLQQLARDGRLGENDEVRTGSDPDWTVVSTVGSLCAAGRANPDTSPATPPVAIAASETDVDQRVASATDENPAWLDVLSQADNANSRAGFAVVGQTEDVNYYARIDGHEEGPLSYPRVTSMLRDGTLSNRDQIRSGERGDWLPIEEHPAFTVLTTAADDPDTLPQIDAQHGTANTDSHAPAEPAIDTPAAHAVLPAAVLPADEDSATEDSTTEDSTTEDSATGDSPPPREHDRADLRADAGIDADGTAADSPDPGETSDPGRNRSRSDSAPADVATPQRRRRGVSIPAWCYSTRTLGITALSLAVFAAAYFLYPRQPPHPGVSGTVTLDGQPLANATMSFLPDDDQLEPAFARTDQKGNYALQQTEAVAGAMPGRYTVRITTYEPAVTEIDPQVAGIPERVPTKYNIKTELAADVEQVENNVIDFPLDSKGQIVQPREVY